MLILVFPFSILFLMQYPKNCIKIGWVESWLLIAAIGMSRGWFNLFVVKPNCHRIVYNRMQCNRHIESAISNLSYSISI